MAFLVEIFRSEIPVENSPSANRCRKKVLKEVIRTHLQPRKSLKRQKVPRSKTATRAQHSRAALIAQFCIAELG